MTQKTTNLLDKFGYGTETGQNQINPENELLSKLTSHEGARDAVTKIRRYFGRSFGSPLSKEVLNHYLDTGENLTEYSQEEMVGRLQQIRQGNQMPPMEGGM